MIKIFKDIKEHLARITFSSQNNFHEILGVIKSQPSTSYDPKHQEWVVPINNLEPLITEFSDIQDENIEIDKLIEDKVKTIESEKSKLLKLKERLKNVTFKVKLQKEIELYPFQQVGAGFLYLKKRALLADVVGLGKTPQSLAAVEKRFAEDSLDKCIIVCPNSLKKKWANDIMKFFGRKAILIDQAGNKRMPQYDKFIECKHSYLIINYDIIRRDFAYIQYIFEITPKERLATIFDEIQYLKNSGTKRHKAIRQLVYMPSVKTVFGLTATYIENGLENLFGIFWIIDRTVFGTNYFRFANSYLQIDYFNKIVGYNNVEDVIQKINVYTIRRQKEQVREQLPKVNYIDYWVDLTAEQVSLYDDILEQIVDSINDTSKKMSVIRANAMSQLTLLNQSCLSAELFDSGEYSAKMDELLEIMSGMDKSKVVIFCHYIKMVEIICRDLNKAGFNSIYMHGQSDLGKGSNRQRTIDEWSIRSDIQVLVTSDILAEGVDLIAASYVINFDLLWNPAKMEQRSGRIDRINQKANQITIINIISKGTIEEKIFAKLQERKEIINTVVDGGYISGRINMMSMSDIKELLGVI